MYSSAQLVLVTSNQPLYCKDFKQSYFHVSTDSETSIDIGDFVREDIEYSATVTGVDIAGNIGEESDPV